METQNPASPAIHLVSGLILEMTSADKLQAMHDLSQKLKQDDGTLDNSKLWTSENAPKSRMTLTMISVGCLVSALVELGVIPELELRAHLFSLVEKLQTQANAEVLKEFDMVNLPEPFRQLALQELHKHDEVAKIMIERIFLTHGNVINGPNLLSGFNPGKAALEGLKVCHPEKAQTIDEILALLEGEGKGEGK